jgi:ElaB/YqjD/DUF883 family membrane-anchored ribosome-binding protein
MAGATFHPRGKDENQTRETGQPRDQNKEQNKEQNPMEKAKEFGSQVTEKAKEFGSQAADKAKDLGSHAADKAKDLGGQVMDKAKEAMSSVGETATNLGKKADEYTATAGTSVKQFGDRIEEQGPHGGMLGQATHAVADTFRTSGQYIEEHKLSGMAEDMAGMIRRNPLPAVCIGFGIGFLLGRAMRA